MNIIDRSLNYGRPLIRRFLKNAGPCGVVLDIGAGAGDDLSLAREANPRARLAALERHPGYIRNLEARGIETHAVDIERDRFPLGSGAVDVVIANQILEHTKEIFWIFDQVSQTLKTGGRLLVGVPNLASLHNRLLLAAGRQPTPLQNHSAHVRGFTKPDMLRFLETVFPGGYRLRDFGGSNFYPFPPMIAKPLAALFPTAAWGIFFHFEKTKDYGGEFLRYPTQQGLETHFFLG